MIWTLLGVLIRIWATVGLVALIIIIAKATSGP